MIDFAQNTNYNICMKWKRKCVDKIRYYWKQYDILILLIAFFAVALTGIAVEAKQFEAEPQIFLDKPNRFVV